MNALLSFILIKEYITVFYMLLRCKCSICLLITSALFNNNVTEFNIIFAVI